jgi:acetoin utilization deacetylase AcuC-like enzyme
VALVLEGGYAVEALPDLVRAAAEGIAAARA